MRQSNPFAGLMALRGISKVLLLCSHQHRQDNMLCPRCKTPVAALETKCRNCGLAISPVSSRPLPTGDTSDSCRYCGHPLGGRDSCEVCGATRGQPLAGPQGIKCPLCGGNLDENLACRKCGSMIGGETVLEESKVQCPGCGGEVSLDDESCGACGIKIWIEGSAESARLDALKCPACGTQVAEGDAKCAHCGFLVWLESEEERADRAKESIRDATTRLVEIKREHGSVPERAMTYLQAAQRILKSGESELATRRAMIAADIAEVDARQKAIFATAVRRAEERMRSAEDRGGDTSRCKELLKMSRQADEKGDRKVAIRLALRCKIMAEGLEGSLSRAPIGA